MPGYANPPVFKAVYEYVLEKDMKKTASGTGSKRKRVNDLGEGPYPGGLRPDFFLCARRFACTRSKHPPGEGERRQGQTMERFC